MKKVFAPVAFFKVPDETLLTPFLNPKDSMSDLPFDLFDGFSMAMGKIVSRTNSLIHVHPHVLQVVFIISGRLTLKMKGLNDDKPYEINLVSNEAVIIEKGELSQLINQYDEDCHVLYIVSPAYLFEIEKGEVIYDDAIVLNYNWNELNELNWRPAEITQPTTSAVARMESYNRISLKKPKLEKEYE